MAAPPSFLLLIPLLLHISAAQQPYLNNLQLNCNQVPAVTLGFLCNSSSTTPTPSSCPSYLTFRSTSTYNNAATVAYLLSADASLIAAANNISDVDPLPIDTLLFIPINCSCSNSFYQHNASYILKQQGENYFSMANNTYQTLTTCQAMEAQNPNHNFRRLARGQNFTVPLRCACLTPNQTAAGFNYLLTYLIRQGDTVSQIAELFAAAGADVESILAANEITADATIYYFTPLLIPLRTRPVKQNISNSPPPPPQPQSPPSLSQISGSGSNKWIFIGAGVGSAVFILFSSILAYYCFCYRRNRRTVAKPSFTLPSKQADFGSESKPFSTWSVSSEGIASALETLTIYKFEELESATEAFSEANRIGGSAVYRGSFKGDTAVVKIVRGDVSREIDALRQIKHSRVVRLSGFSLHQGLTYLVYEYVDNGPLVNWLDRTRGDNRLDWKQRVQCAYDVADALNYLHNFTNPTYIHKNLTSGNIYLDADTRAKVANFGLSRTFDTDDQNAMTRHVVGTYGYMAPEYTEFGLVTPKLDVFALGVVMLELLSGRKAVEGNDDEQVLLYKVVTGEGKVKELMDPWLGEEYPEEVAYSMAQLATSCVANDPNDRPSISDVFVTLSKLLSSSLIWDPTRDGSWS